MAPPRSNKKRSDKGGKRRGEAATPDGSIAVARGLTRREAEETQKQLLESRSQKEDKERIEKYFEGPHAHEAKERRSILKDNDQNEETIMANSNLSAIEQHALVKRRARKGDKVLEAKMAVRDTKRLEAAVAASDAQLLLHTEAPGMIEPENDMERTSRLSQSELKHKYLNAQTARHIYDFTLTDHAPYGIKYGRSGRHAIIYGSRGHVSVMDCHAQSLVTEFHLPGERIRDATFLHNASLLAVAQSNHAYIYDNTGAEIHRLPDHQDPFCLDFLPHHWLLVSLGRAGWLKYHDTSTGQLVSQHRTQMGASSVMRQNPTNAVMHIGHKNGSVTMWSPASSTYLVKLQCHKGAPITSLAVGSGHYMVTGGADRQVKIWDLRMYKELHAYYAIGIPTSLDISQRGILGIGHGTHATFWKSVVEKHVDPYMYHAIPGCGSVETLRFRPFEDVVGLGHGRGISSIVIPGSGEPNLDMTEYHTNPFADRKQEREMEVRSLMDKLSPDMIALDPDVVGTIESVHLRTQRIQQQQEDNDKLLPVKKKQKSKKRGKSKIQTQLRRKARNVVDEATMKLREAKEQAQKQQQQQSKDNDDGGGGSAAQKFNPKMEVPAALKRFFT